jgi:hypothetical protein
MPFLGQTPPSQFSSIAKQTITGNSGTTYTLDYSVTNSNELEVFINNVRQEPGVAYTASGTSIVFSEAVTSSDSIYVVYQGRSIGSVAPSDGSVNVSTLSSALYNSTQYFKIPVGTTSQRPSSSTSGMTRYNSTTGKPEWYDPIDSTWRDFSSIGGGYDYSIETLVIAGGGGADNDHGGGGGAGGLLFITPTVTTGSAYAITVGAGGAGDAGSAATNGSNSSFTSDEWMTAIGGGAAGNGNGAAGNPGGSGGGGGGNTNNYRTRGGPGVPGQGHGGGCGGYQALGEPGGGGGGSGAPGGDAIYNTSAGNSWAGNGGAGTYRFATWASATSTGADGGYYAGGGGGGCTNGSGGYGGYGGGGAGSTGSTAGNGNSNTGGGGGSCGNGGTGGNGGSGLVIIRYAGSQRGTGGIIASSGGYTYHTFTSSGTYTA